MKDRLDELEGVEYECLACGHIDTFAEGETEIDDIGEDYVCIICPICKADIVISDIDDDNFMLCSFEIE